MPTDSEGIVRDTDGNKITHPTEEELTAARDNVAKFKRHEAQWRNRPMGYREPGLKMIRDALKAAKNKLKNLERKEEMYLLHQSGGRKKKRKTKNKRKTRRRRRRKKRKTQRGRRRYRRRKR